MTESNVRTYALYAVGEIALVVLGILIALQINNWNEDRRDGRTRHDYYQQLMTDLDAQRVYLESSIARLDSSIAAYERYEQVFEAPGLTLDQVQESFSLLEFRIAYVSFDSNTMETLQNTGDIKLMPVEIRNALIDLKSHQDLLTKIADGNQRLYLEEAQDAYAAGLNPLTSRLLANPRQQPELLAAVRANTNPVEVVFALESAFLIKTYTERERIRSFNAMLDEIDALEALIQDEIAGGR
jgi:exonuclease VII small subunit